MIKKLIVYLLRKLGAKEVLPKNNTKDEEDIIFEDFFY